ncbi:MAG: HepT-like ribonuclease domain-containing protein [Anaerolinea sp.]
MKPTRAYLLDSLVYLDDILTFTAGMEEPDFVKNRQTQLAVIRAFEVIGEIIKRIPQDVLEQQQGVDWRAIKGFRDVLIHQYDNVDLAIVWDAVRRVPQVKQAVLALLADLPSSDTNFSS